MFARTLPAQLLSILIFTVPVDAAPTITLWYGTNQAFGQIGNPQTAINILGNVSDPGGILSLSYTLNGGSSIALSRGPDRRRLLLTGDFNIDIYTSALNNGSNTIVVTATNNQNQTSTQTVTLQYTAGQVWPQTYAINWSTVSSINSVAHVVDGPWTLGGGIVKPTYLGYDRLIAIGNTTWTDYEVTVPITIRRIDTAGFQWPSISPGVGLLFRWTGHTDDPISGWQPKTGYLPIGAIAWYAWEWSNPAGPPRMKLVGNNLAGMQEDLSGFTMSFNVAYYFKMRVETIPGQGGSYKFKVWQQGQAEPSLWLLQGQGSLSDPQSGSFCLLSHHVESEFGNVTVTPLTYVTASIKTFLEGPYNATSSRMDTSLQSLLPPVQPYNMPPWNHGGAETMATVPANVIDWVVLELRTGTAASTKVATRAGLMTRDGVIVDLDGVSPVAFGGVAPGNYYVVVRHRNHLPVMTASALNLAPNASLYDFSTSQSKAYGTMPMAALPAGVFGMVAGDANASDLISASDANNIFGVLNATTYTLSDVNMSGIVTASDANLVFRNLNRTSQVP